MNIAYLADQIISHKNILHPEIKVGPSVQSDYHKSPITSTTLFQLKEEFESIIERIEENVDLKLTS